MSRSAAVTARHARRRRAQGGSGFGVASGERLRRGDRVCRAAFLGPFECGGSVAQLPFERFARRCRLRQGLFKRLAGIALLALPLCLGFFERG